MIFNRLTFFFASLCSVAVFSSHATAQSDDVHALYKRGYVVDAKINGGYPHNSNTFPVTTPHPPIIGTQAAKTPTAELARPAPPAAFKQPVQLAPIHSARPVHSPTRHPAYSQTYVPNTRPIETQEAPKELKYPEYPSAPAYNPPAYSPPPLEPIRSIETKPALATLPVAAQPAPSYISEPAYTASASPLSDDTLNILKGLPRYVSTTKRVTAGRVSVQRTDIDDQLDMNIGKTKTADSIGMSIAVREYTFSDEYELQRAYDAIANGDTTLANSIYEAILNNHPNNQDALFGYATLNQRLENKRRARAIYGRLLRLNPKHTEGLNNFLALVIEESPTEALPYLQALIKNNPKFAPAYAQIAGVYQHLNDAERARRAMSNALSLDPDNLVYRYNYAVLLDEQKHYKAASELYLSLIRASLQGQPIPADADQIQQRLRFIQTAKTT